MLASDLFLLKWLKVCGMWHKAKAIIASCHENLPSGRCNNDDIIFYGSNRSGIMKFFPKEVKFIYKRMD